MSRKKKTNVSRLLLLFLPMTLSAPTAAPPLSDEELWIHFAREDCNHSFEILMERFQERLSRFVGKWVREESRIEDLIQAMWLRAIRSKSTFNPSMRLGTWLHAILGNLIRNEGRSQARRRVRPESDFRLADAETVQLRAAVSSDCPEEMMRGRAVDHALESSLSRLPVEQRRIFELRFVQGYSNEEVASILAQPLGSVKAKAKRVRLRVRGELREMMDM